MNRRRKIILHIGAPKTGSTAIQNFLGLNAEALRTEGIIVPDDDLGMSGPVSGSHLRKMVELRENPVEGGKALEIAIANIFESANGASAILISAEHLAANKSGPRLFERLAESHDIEVILYIRRQDEFILSAWQQWGAKTEEDFLAWLLSVVGRQADWAAYLKNWETIVPRDKITVRIFDRRQMKDGDVIADFFDLLGLSTPFKAFTYPPSLANPSLAEAIVDLVRGSKHAFRDRHDNRFQGFVHDVSGDRFVKNSRESILTAAQRRAIVKRYAASNRWVRQNYFPDRKEDLFAPIEDGNYFCPTRGEWRRQQLEFLALALYGLYRWRERKTTDRNK